MNKAIKYGVCTTPVKQLADKNPEEPGPARTETVKVKGASACGRVSKMMQGSGPRQTSPFYFRKRKCERGGVPNPGKRSEGVGKRKCGIAVNWQRLLNYFLNYLQSQKREGNATQLAGTHRKLIAPQPYYMGSSTSSGGWAGGLLTNPTFFLRVASSSHHLLLS